MYHREIYTLATSGKTDASEHYNFFRRQMEGKVAAEEIDGLLEPALIFLVDASGVPVLLSLLVLIFTSGGEDLSQLPTNQFALYELGIQHAIDKRFYTAYTSVLGGGQDGANAGNKLAYDDALATRTLVQMWQQLFALDRTKAIMVMAGGEDGKKEKTEKVRRKGGLDQGSDAGHSDVIAQKSIQKGEERSDNDLYDIFKDRKSVV